MFYVPRSQISLIFHRMTCCFFRHEYHMTHLMENVDQTLQPVCKINEVLNQRHSSIKKFQNKRNLILDLYLYYIYIYILNLMECLCVGRDTIDSSATKRSTTRIPADDTNSVSDTQYKPAGHHTKWVCCIWENCDPFHGRVGILSSSVIPVYPM